MNVDDIRVGDGRSTFTLYRWVVCALSIRGTEQFNLYPGVQQPPGIRGSITKHVIGGKN